MSRCDCGSVRTDSGDCAAVCERSLSARHDCDDGLGPSCPKCFDDGVAHGVQDHAETLARMRRVIIAVNRFAHVARMIDGDLRVTREDVLRCIGGAPRILCERALALLRDRAHEGPGGPVLLVSLVALACEEYAPWEDWKL